MWAQVDGEGVFLIPHSIEKYPLARGTGKPHSVSALVLVLLRPQGKVRVPCFPEYARTVKELTCTIISVVLISVGPHFKEEEPGMVVYKV